VNYLLDTHAVIWMTSRRRSVRPDLVDALNQPDSRVLVSAVSAFEVATKVRLGRLDDARELADHWAQSMVELGVISIDLTTAHAIAAGQLVWDHRDPFDRLLAAQAITDELTLVTADPVFRSAPGLALEPW
jgi:PIN domain nuclease of toxin-antitoxin system